MNWNDQEFIAQREHQASAGDVGPSDIASQAGKTAAMAATPPGEPPVDYDVRSVYESRPVNARDFNISGTVLGTVTGSGAIIFPQLNFQSVLGWRFVVLEWDIVFSPGFGAIGSPHFQNTTVNLLGGGGVADPFNQGVIIGPNGTGPVPLKTFMLVEENTRFGIQILNSDTGLTVADQSTAIVTVYGNALPVTDVQLPYQIANPVRRGKVGMFAPPMFFQPPTAPAAPAAVSAGAVAAPARAALPQRFAAPRAPIRSPFVAMPRPAASTVVESTAPTAPRRVIRPGSI